MLPFGIGFSEIIVVLLILIIFVGPEGIPQAVRTVTKVIKAIRSMIDEIKYSEEFDEVKREILQPLDEARRFNPRQKAEAWVKNEIESPIRDFTKEHVEDFQKAMDSKPTEEHSSSDLDPSNRKPESMTSNSKHGPKEELKLSQSLENNNHEQTTTQVHSSDKTHKLDHEDDHASSHEDDHASDHEDDHDDPRTLESATAYHKATCVAAAMRKLHRDWASC